MIYIPFILIFLFGFYLTLVFIEGAFSKPGLAKKVFFGSITVFFIGFFLIVTYFIVTILYQVIV